MHQPLSQPIEPPAHPLQGTGQFDIAEKSVYAGTPNRPGARDALVQELGVIMLEEFGIATTEQEIQQLAQSLTIIFGALAHAHTDQRSPQDPP